LLVRIRDAIALCLEVEGDDTDPFDFVGVQSIAVCS
jgi:hypothetical protein